MKRRKVLLTIEVETVATLKELGTLREMVFDTQVGNVGKLCRDWTLESSCVSLGTITQVQVNVITNRRRRTASAK